MHQDVQLMEEKINQQSLEQAYIKRALFESYYQGWTRKERGLSCDPPKRLGEEMREKYVQGYQDKERQLEEDDAQK